MGLSVGVAFARSLRHLEEMVPERHHGNLHADLECASDRWP